MLIRNQDIIVTGLQPWDIDIGSNCKNIALEFAKNNRVLYVNAALDRMTLLCKKNDPKVQRRKRILHSAEPDLLEIGPHLWNLYPKTILESINQIGSDNLFDWLNKINNRRMARQILSAVKRLDFKDYIIFCDSDMFRSFYLKELLNPKAFIYYTRDNLVAVDYWKKQGIRVEAAMMKKADVVVANSTYLAKLAEAFNPHSSYVGQGCDVSLFDQKLIERIPQDMLPIKEEGKPIIGYIGALKALRLDINVLLCIAKERPNWNIVLVGPEDEPFKTSDLHQFDNVHFLGNKTEPELPLYLSTFDVAINPQIVNEVTVGNYPRKIDEYLAMGKPVVATKTEAMSVFAEYVSLASTKEDYLTMIQKELDTNSSEKITERELFARTHTWENNVQEISNSLVKVIAI
ncbi:MAG: glycosyltransferase [Bacteroidales bacterium]|nr:glycosyltransferase [Bacteroidales bacterium]